MEHLGRLAEKGLTVKLNQLIAEGDTVVALTEVTAGGETGQDADVFTLRDGKTVRVTPTATRRCWSVCTARSSSPLDNGSPPNMGRPVTHVGGGPTPCVRLHP